MCISKHARSTNKLLKLALSLSTRGVIAREYVHASLAMPASLLRRVFQILSPLQQHLQTIAGPQRDQALRLDRKAGL